MSWVLFYLKKVIGMLLMPIPFTLMLLIVSLFLMRKWPNMARVGLVASILLLATTSWEPISNRLIATVEQDFAVFDTQQPIDVVVVLGSGHKNITDQPAVMALGQSALFRLEEGLRILQANPKAELFVSGYSGSMQEAHAYVMRKAALELGVAADRIRTFPEAKDTQEEAQSMAPYLTGKRVALVTEASHLKRAKTYFDTLDAQIYPAPALFLGSDTSGWKVSAYGAYQSERTFYEWLGRIWQWLKGTPSEA